MDLTEVTKKLRELESNIEQFAPAALDQFAEENAKAAIKSGMSAVLIRQQMWRCCEWCANLAGVYDYGKKQYPRDVFKRHKCCRCIVTVKFEKGGFQDVWSKKEYSTQREAVQERMAAFQEEAATVTAEERQEWLRKLTQQQDHREAFDRARREALARGESFFDSTEFYTNLPPTDPGSVTDCPTKFNLRGKEFEIDGKFIEFKPKGEERPTAEWLADRFGYQVTLMPRISEPPEIKCGDYMINGTTLFDLKNPKGGTKNTINNQFHEKRGQAEVFIINITNVKLPRDQIIKYTEEAMMSPHHDWVQEVRLIEGANGDYRIVRTYTRT